MEGGLNVLLPEAALALLVLLLVLLDALLWPRRPSCAMGYMALCGCLGVLAFSLREWQAEGVGYRLGEMVHQDGFAAFCDVLILCVLVGVLLLCLHESRWRVGDGHYALLCMSALGMMLAVSAADILVVFLALELAAMPLYVLAAGEEGIARRWEGEAAAKFLHLGLFASALFLFGAALVYIGAGTTSLQGMASHWGEEGYAEVVLPGVALLIAGLLCKAAAVPFHAWSVDVREGVPASLSAFIGGAGMATALVVLARLLLIGLEPLREIWEPVVGGVAALTMLVASLLSLNSRSLKRLWAYLGIAHMGYALAALAAGRGEGLAVVLFGLVTASLSGVALFAGAALKEERGAARPHLAAYRGLGREQPLLGALLVVSVLSLVGLPPTAGFSARLYAVHALVDAELTWLAVVVVATLPLAFYACVRFIINMYARRQGAVRRVEPSAELLVVLLLAATVAIGAGLLPEVLMETARSAAVSLM